MSKTVDQRVVEMRFDNSNFEKNVSTTMSTLDKLKAGLRLDGATKGLQNVNAAAKNVNMSGLSTAVETVRTRFSALEVMAVTALANITNSAVNAGKRIVAALTIDPIKTGFDEYETKINAIQTIMSNTASKGTTMADVTQVLGELNTYADKTIYNFAEMTRNIGTFTAAGVGLEEAASAIQGIANLAAASGSNSQQASTAMYQLSQALAAGTVKLMDWNSVVNAGMGGEKFQEALKETAREHGVAVDAIIKEQGSFRESLTRGWITADVLNDTLKKFTVEGAKDYAESMKASGKYTQEMADALIKEAQSMEDAATKVKTFTQLWDTMKEAAQSGWSQTWELIVGDFEEAKAFFSELSDLFGGIIGAMSDSRNKLLAGALGSGWDQLTTKINDVGISTETFQEALKATAKEHSIAIDKMIKEEGSLEGAMKKLPNSGKLISETIQKFVNAALGVDKATSSAAKSVKELGDVVNKVIRGDFGNGADRVKALTKAGYDYAKVQSMVNKVMAGGKIDFEKMSDAQLENIGYTKEQIKALRELSAEAKRTGTPINELINNLEKPSGRTLLIESLMNALHGVVDACKAVGAAWRETFPPMTSEQLYNIIEGVHSLSEHLVVTDETADKITRTFRGLFAILDIITTITGGAARIAFKLLTKVLGLFDLNILDVTASIGDSIAAFRDWLFETNAVAKGIEKVITTVKKWYDAFMAIPEVQQGILDFKRAVSDTMIDLKEYFSVGGERINEFIERIKSMDSITLDDLKGIFKDFKDNVLDYFVDFDSVFENIRKAIENFKTKVKSYFDEVGEDVNTLKGKIINFFKEVKAKFSEHIGLGEILTIGIGAGLILIIKQITNIIDAFAGPLGSFIDLFDNLGDVFSAYAKKVKSEALLNQAKAIAIVAGALAVLALLDTKKLWQAAGVLGAVAGGLVIFSAAMGVVNKFLPSGAVSVSGIVGIAAALGILVLALREMQDLDQSSLTRNLKVLGVMVVALAVLVAALNNTTPILSKGQHGMSTSALSIIAIAAAVKILVSALKDIDSIDSNNIEKSLGVLIGLMVGLGIVATLSRGIKFGVGLGAIGMVLALKILVSALEDISKINVGRILNNIEGIIVIFGMLSLLMLASRLGGGSVGTAGMGILAMAAAILIMIPALMALSNMDAIALDNAINVLTKISAIFGAVVAVSMFAGKHAAKAGVMLLMMSGAILILTGVITILSHLDPEAVNRALGVIVALELVFGVLIAVTGLVGKIDENAVKVLGKLAVIIGILAIALGALSMIDSSQLKGATIALSTVIGVFSLLVASTALAKKASGSLIVMTFVVGALAGILYLLSSLEVGSTLEVAASLSLLLLAMSTSLAIISAASPLAMVSIGALALMTLIVAGLAAIIGVLAHFDVGPTLEIAASLSLLLLSMSGALAILALVGAGGPAAFIGIGALATLIVGIGGIIAGIGALADHYPEMETFIDKGIPLLEKIGTGIGAFVGGLIGGALGGLTAGLPLIGGNISQFVANIMPGVTGLKMVDDAAVNGAKNIASIVLSLAGADLLNGIASLFGAGTSSLSTLGEQLVPFGEAMAAFSETVSGRIDEEAVNAAAGAGQMLADLNKNLPRQGGALQDFFGEKDLSVFGTQLQTFGTCIVAFSETVKGHVNEEAVKAAANSGMAMSELANSLPKQGGEWQNFFGEKDLSVFGTQLKTFGACIVAFSDTVKGKVDEEAVKAAANSGKMMSDLANSIPKQDGVFQNWFGEQNLSVFGTQLKTFGECIVAFSSAVSGKVNEEAVTAAANAGQAISALANGLPKQNGVFQNFLGEQDLAEFGRQLQSFGYNFAIYSQYMEGVKADVVNTTSYAATSLVTLANSLPDNKLFKNETTLDEFGAQLAKFGTHFGNYYNSISEIDTAKLSGALSSSWGILNMIKDMAGTDFGVVSQFNKALNDLGKTGVKGFVDAFTQSGPQVIQAANQMIMNFLTEVKRLQPTVKETFTMMMEAALTIIKNKYRDFEHVGEQLIVKLKGGMENKESAVLNAVTDLMEGALALFEQYKGAFYESGCEAATGFANGIRDNIGWIEQAAQEAAEAAAEAARVALDQNSPSRVFYDIGDGTTEGFVLAMHDGMSTVWNASSDMAYEAVDGFNYVVSKIGDLIENGIDAEPTIRPVLDLSNVESGARRLNAMLSTSQAMSISSSMNQSRSSVSQNQNGVATTGAVNNFAFTQNNYSPKALSKTDIYRQTKNQFSAMERMVRA